MTPFAEGSVAAARRELTRCLAELKTACRAAAPECFRHVALAMGHAATAEAQLDAALEIEAIAEKENAA